MTPEEPANAEPVRLYFAGLAADFGSQLAVFGVAEAEPSGWVREPSLLRPGLTTFVRHLGIGASVVGDIQTIFVGDLKGHSLSDAFTQFADRLRSNLRAESSATCKEVLFINLMPLHMAASQVDKIVQGVFGAGRSEDEWLARFSTVVILLRNIDWLTKSAVFRERVIARNPTYEIVAVDLRGYGISFKRDGTTTVPSIPREFVRTVLDVDERSIYKSLVFETNSFIGHFALRSAHVRTHYNLIEFIRKDNVWEYLYGRFVELTRSAEKLLIVGVGLEDRVIQIIGDQLRALLGQEKLIEFIHHAGKDAASVVPIDWAENYDRALIVTDIVCTGDTVRPWLARLKATGDVESVGIFAIASMQNSPTRVEGVNIHNGVQIKRRFYPPDGCELCAIRQPLVTISALENFRIAEGQLTPYDFWEMVADSHALQRDLVDAHGRQIPYRISTNKLVQRYGTWIGNVIRHRVSETWPNLKIDALCCVDEEHGSEFGKLVSRVLNVRYVVRVPRSQLTRLTTAGGLPTDVANPLGNRRQVLVVDDGINSGDTMRALIRFCRSADVVPVGALVLDSRLDEGETRRLSAEMSNRSIVALYSWPGHVGTA